MEDRTQIFVFTSPEIEELLLDNQIDLVALLQREGINVSKGFAKNPASNAKSGCKDPTTVILASAALILSITPIISKIIASLSHKKVVTYEWQCLPVEDSNGNVVRDDYGKPILQWVERARFLESSTERQSDYQIYLKGPVGLEIGYTDSPKKILPGSDYL